MRSFSCSADRARQPRAGRQGRFVRGPGYARAVRSNILGWCILHVKYRFGHGRQGHPAARLGAAEGVCERHGGRGAGCWLPGVWSAGTSRNDSRATTSSTRFARRLPTRCRCLQAAALNPEHIVRMTWYIIDKQEYLEAPAGSRSRLSGHHRAALSGHGGGGGGGAAGGPREGGDRNNRGDPGVNASRAGSNSADSGRRCSDDDERIGSQKSRKTANRRCSAWVQLLKTAKRIESEVASHFANQHNTSLSRFDVLANLERSPGHATGTSQLSKMLLASRGNITRLLDRMENDRAHSPRTPAPATGASAKCA